MKVNVKNFSSSYKKVKDDLAYVSSLLVLLSLSKDPNLCRDIISKLDEDSISFLMIVHLSLYSSSELNKMYGYDSYELDHNIDSIIQKELDGSSEFVGDNFVVSIEDCNRSHDLEKRIISELKSRKSIVLQ